MKKIKDFVSHFFILSILFLTIVSVYAIWANNAKDLLIKSFESVMLLLFVSLVVLFASKYMHSDAELGNMDNDEQAELNSIEIFKMIRKVTVSALIGSVALLAFVGMLSIWDVISDEQVLQKTLASISCLIFSSIIIVTVCVLRVSRETFGEKFKSVTMGDIGKVFLAVIFIAWFFVFIMRVLF